VVGPYPIRVVGSYDLPNKGDFLSIADEEGIYTTHYNKLKLQIKLLNKAETKILCNSLEISNASRVSFFFA
jgi:hypothetical protein